MRRIARLSAGILRSNVRESPLPYRLTFAVTSRCQGRCVMCNIWRKPPQDELTHTEIEALFTKTGHFSWINLTGGELFQRLDVHEVLLAIVNNSRSLYLLNFPTNGCQTAEIVAAVEAILHRTRLPRLIVSVSLDGPPDLHDRIRGIDGCWDHAVRTFAFLRKRRSRRFSVYLGHTVQTANLGRFDETLRAVDQALGSVSADDFHLNLAHASAHYYDNKDTDALPDPERAVAEIERIRRQQSPRLLDPVAFIEQRYQRHVRDYLSSGRGPFVCEAGGTSCFIDPTGIIHPCTVFDAPIGSLRDFSMDFRRLWSSNTRSDTRKLIKNGQCPGCWTPCEAYQTLLANLFRQKN